MEMTRESLIEYFDIPSGVVHDKVKLSLHMNELLQTLEKEDMAMVVDDCGMSPIDCLVKSTMTSIENVQGYSSYLHRCLLRQTGGNRKKLLAIAKKRNVDIDISTSRLMRLQLVKEILNSYD